MTERNKTFQVKVNEFIFLFTEKEIAEADLIQSAPGEYNLIRNHRSVNTKLINCDATAKKSKIEVDGEFYAVEIKDELDQMLDTMGFSNVSAKHEKEIKAPMPGLVLDVAVHVGQEVHEGERVLILEAMKMENSITTHCTAVIKKILVEKGQPVEKGQILVELE